MKTIKEPFLVRGRHNGRWLLKTSSGARYVLDLDAMASTRFADQPRHGEYDLAVLRRDGETVPLLDFEPVRIGYRCMLLLGELDDYPGYVATWRDTTPVVSVDRLDS